MAADSPVADLVAQLHDFHFQRPAWWLAVLPAIAAAVWLHRRQNATGWRQIIAPELAPFLLEATDTTAPRLAWWAVLAWLLACMALAGPSWQRLPQPIYKQERPLVIALDLSPSLLARDLKPDRITRVRLKLLDLLAARREGSTALVAYAGDSHAVSPLTDDADTIAALLPALHPTIMPVAGNRPDEALAMAVELLISAHHNSGDLLLVTDGIPAKAVPAMDALMRAHPNVRLSVLGVGTAEGAPIAEGGGGFIKNTAGDILIARLDVDQLSAFAERHGGRYATISTDATDILYLTEPLYALPGSNTKAVDRTFDTWQDNGHWLTLPLLVLALLAFRRRLFAMLLVAPLLAFNPTPSQALDWDQLWLNQNQRGARALEQGQAKTAAQLFTDPVWKGVAAYRAGDFAAAEKLFATDSSADGFYNRGNALAQAGQLDDAIAAYDQALRLQPDMASAKANRKLVDELRKQQKPPTGNQDSDSDSGGGNSADKQQDKGSGNESTNKEQGHNAPQPGENAAESDGAEASRTAEHQADGQSDADAQQKPASAAANNEQQHADAEKSANTQTPATDERGDKGSANADHKARAESNPLSDEQQQTLEQWLRRVPDDPGGLLRRKFDYESSRPRQQSGERAPWRRGPLSEEEL